ncbi:MAG: anthranilate phosphoribosyltransferase [Polyangiaceae bacterium]|nr:anthranilate phosphoribosyltransferase [Polyangiaceae bacterium]
MSGAALESLCRGRSLDATESAELFTRIAKGDVAEVELAALLVALRCKGESADELAGAASALLRAAPTFPPFEGEVADVCGTGGDGFRTLNVSTAVAFVVAAAGVRVVKHGGRAVTSASGSTDALLALGVQPARSCEQASRDVADTGLAFISAADVHVALRSVAAVRRQLGVRTTFNLLGPMLNPARPSIRLVGVPEPRFVRPVAEALQRLGTRVALVVHGSGTDEISLRGPTSCALLRDGSIEDRTIDPGELGLGFHEVDALRVESAAESAARIEACFDGCGRDADAAVIAANAGGLLWIAGKSSSLGDGVADALGVIRSGRARAMLDEHRARTGGAA